MRFKNVYKLHTLPFISGPLAVSPRPQYEIIPALAIQSAHKKQFKVSSTTSILH
jgi:hypothetical protein